MYNKYMFHGFEQLAGDSSTESRLWMLNCDLNSSLPDWVIEHPETAEVFETLGLDVSCGGKSLEYLCDKQSLEPVIVLQQLEDAIHNEQKNSKRRSRREN